MLTAHLTSLLAAPLALAWRPFLDPLDIRDGWLALLPPIVFAVALVYKTLKLPKLDRIWLEATKLTGYILILMFAAAVALWALVESVERL